MKKNSTAKGSGQSSRPKYNPNRKPDSMTLEEWQVALRRQAAKAEALVVRKGDFAREGYFSVTSPRSGNHYSVVFRGLSSSWNYCSCPDFKTNRLGTCKHLEAVAMAADGKYAAKKYRLPACTTVYLDYKGERRVRVRIGGGHSEEMSGLIGEYFDDDLTLREEKYGCFHDFMEKAREIDPATRCFDDALEFVIGRREAERRNRIADSCGSLTDGLLKVPLYPYQKEGAEFAFRHGRCVIADEMGLGKTVQAIACAKLLRKHGLAASVWIVCPTSLKYQWRNEIRKFAGEEAMVVEGDVVARAHKLSEDSVFFKIISYQSLVNTIRFGLKRMPDMIVYDEVQRLKNWDTKMARTMRRLRSDYVVAISGTPLENRLSELYSVMQLVDQFALGPYWQFTAETTQTDEIGKIVGYRNLNEVGDKLKDVLIRRTKSSVRLQMPSRVDKSLFVTMTKEQRAIHDDCKWNVGILIHRWHRSDFLSERDRLRLMQLLATMRMACNSTFIIDQKTRHDTKIDEAVNIINDTIESGDEKIVIFSQWERMQRILAAELENRGIGFRFLHGGVPSAKRGVMIDEFLNDPECRVFLSTDAGSTGLNLQRASIVINLDLPWNPAVLEQRIGRVYRLGQDRQVQVINMVAANTIEESMLGTLAFKSGLFEGVFDGGEGTVALNDRKFGRIAELLDEEFQEEDVKETDTTYGNGEYEESSQETEEDVFDETDTDTPEHIEDDILEEEYEEIADGDYPTEAAGADNESAPDKVPESQPSGADEQIGGQNDAGADANGADGSGSRSKELSDAPQELIARSVEVLGGLAKAISTPETRKRLVDTLVKEDPATGKVSINIPVKDRETVSGILDMMAGFLSSLC